MTVQRIFRPARLLYLRPSLCVCQRTTTATPAVAFYSASATDGPPSFAPPRQSGPIDPQPASELQLGELPGGTFRIEPLRRVGEDITTTRARLLCRGFFFPKTRHHAELTKQTNRASAAR